jgi:hypothetical protein
MSRAVLRTVAVLLVVGTLACAPRTSGAPPPAQAPPAQSQPAPAPNDAERIWQELAAAARPEGKIVVASNNAAVRETMAEAFKKRFGIEVEVLTGRGSEAVARIMRERAAGVHTVDVLISGMGTASSELYPANCLSQKRHRICAALPVKEVCAHAKPL